MHMFQPVRAHWHLNSCLLPAVRCTNIVSYDIGLCLSSKTWKSSYAKWKEENLCVKKKLKEYSDRNLKEKLWYEVYESVVTKLNRNQKKVRKFRRDGKI